MLTTLHVHCIFHVCNHISILIHARYQRVQWCQALIRLKECSSRNSRHALDGPPQEVVIYQADDQTILAGHIHLGILPCQNLTEISLARSWADFELEVESASSPCVGIAPDGRKPSLQETPMCSRPWLVPTSSTLLGI